MVATAHTGLGACAESAARPGSAFEVRDAAFGVDGRLLLAPLTLRFEAARFYGLIGHNGSGKSTWLLMGSRVVTGDQGGGGLVREHKRA